MTDTKVNMEAVREEVHKAIEKFEKEKESAEKQKLAEDMISKAKDTINSLSEELEAKKAELADLEDNRAEFEKKFQELNEEVENLKAELDKAVEATKEQETRAEAAENKLAEITKDRTLDARVAELEEAKVLKTGDKLESQKAKVREMTDEEFASYKEDLVELRSEMEEAVRTEMAADKDSGDDEADVDVAPPTISKDNKEAASIDVEDNNSAGDMWAKFGASLAKKMQNEDK